MSVSCDEIMSTLRHIAPEKLAEEWDNTGIQLLSGSNDVERILVCLEINDKIVEESISNNIDLIVTHHPLIFSSLKKVSHDNWLGNTIIKLLKEDIKVYSAHTSFDSTTGGNNDYLAELLGLKRIGPLKEQSIENYYKLVVYVPEEGLDKVKEAICLAGAGRINNYSDCTFFQKGTGTFLPNSNANPYIGKANKTEYVSEYRLESIVPEGKLNGVLSHMVSAHPYEEPAYDVFKLENKINPTSLGRTGELDQDKPLKDISALLKEKLNIEEPISVIGTLDRPIKKIGICTGSGMDLIHNAVDKGCQLFITGDVKYHDAQTALQLGIALIDAKHFHTEKIFVRNMAEKLKEVFNGRVEIIASEVNLNPFQYL